MTGPARPADFAARERIRGATDATLFVNAGAGSGKTTALVQRVRTLVLHDGVPLARIAAVTFTERAGAELRDRLRAEFEAAYRARAADTERAGEALDDLDGAAIGTLHAFAQRILAEHPVEAGLPPLIEVLDEVGSSVAFEARWSGLQADLLDDDAIAEPLLLALATGVKLDNIRSLVQLLTNDWDMIADHVLAGPEPTLARPDVAGFIARGREFLTVRETCRDDTDKLLAKLNELAGLVDELAATDDLELQLPLLSALAGVKYGRAGQAAAWGGKEGKATALAGASALSDEAGQLCAGLADACLRILARWTARRVLVEAAVRRGEGRLEFHDLLVLARDVLRRNADVRAAAHEDYQRLLLDEFQDTDPIQIEIAARICAGREADDADWRQVEIPPGRLFVVGDAKQSIYRFRRADIATYLDAQRTLGEQASLTTNFRSAPGILRWINSVFGELIQPHASAQPEYEALAEHRAGGAAGPEMTLLGAIGHVDKPNAATLREREAADVAGAVRQILDEAWTVWDSAIERWRPARHDDVAILVPARTSLPFLTDALDEAGVPFRAEASSLVYHAEEVRALLAAARAVADATDALSLVTALRSPLFGCGDDDLWTWRRDVGRLSIHVDIPEASAESPVGRAIGYLKRLAYDVRWLAPSELLARLVRDRRMLEVAATDRRARDQWRRLRFVVDQARAWSEVSGGGLRAYLAWAARQGAETTRVAEAVLPETDTESIRILTVHAAKGLEFPIVILSGMTSRANRRTGVTLLWTAGGYEVRTRAGVQTEQFDAVQPVDEQMGELERLRLLYVAATRARDHLVVSLHRDSHSGADTPALKIASTSGVLVGAQEFHASPVRSASMSRPASVAAPPPWVPWLHEIEQSRAASTLKPAITASGLEGTEPDVAIDESPGLAKGPRDLDLPPWSKGRYGSAIGRAVHAVLQSVDLATGGGHEAAVAAQAIAEGLVGHEAQIRALTESALRCDVVRRAAESEHWRESYVGTTLDDGRVLEGYVDLIYRNADGSLMVVDYKTDAIPAGAVASRVAYYQPQLDAYRQALEAATGARVRTTLLFLHPETDAVAVTG